MNGGREMKNKHIFYAIVCLTLFLACPAVSAPVFLIEPYLQDPATDGMTIMWETADGDNRIEYWKTGDTPTSMPASNIAGTDIYSVTLTGLDSNTTYHYQACTDLGCADAYRFKTWPTALDPVTDFKMIAFSDSQGDWPERLQDLCDNGIIDKECTDGLVENCPEDIAAIVITGDIVTTGSNITQWREDFFAGCQTLFHYVPVLPAMGNHDWPFVNYLNYFTLPENGTSGYEEQWYHVDYLNLRLITLNSNTVAGEQWDWFDTLLSDTCDDTHIDYVLTQFHHPCKTELWPVGESAQSCDFVGRLEDFTDTCAKPSGHLFGHTHGYSRGQSRDATHIWANVATASGDIDFWNEYLQMDYDEFQVSYDEYGFVVFHVSNSPQASLRMVRRTGGDDDHYYGYTDSTIRDEFFIESTNNPPYAPEAVSPVEIEVEGRFVLLQATPFTDLDGDGHLSSHWQVTTIPGDYSHPVVDVWGNETRFENIWKDENTQAGVDISTLTVNLAPDATYYWRVRYRDEHFEWSDWSSEVVFSTVPLPPWEPAATMGAEAESASKAVNYVFFLMAAFGVLLFFKGLKQRRYAAN